MAHTVHNGYTPNELESFEKHEKKVAIFVLGMLFGMIATGTIPEIIYGIPLKDHVPPEIWDIISAMLLVELLATTVPMIYFVPRNDFRIKICKSLAGLELGVFHCADDLVIIVGLSRECADMVIDGQYDNWLKSRQVCKLIG